MKKYHFILIIFSILFYLLSFYFNYLSVLKDRKVYLSDINKSIINIKDRVKIDSELIFSSFYTLWGLDKSKLLERRENIFEKSKDKKNKELVAQRVLKKNIDLKKRKICLNENCWEFMGIVTINNKVEVTLLSSETKPKLESFHVGDELLEGLIISKIKGDDMTVIHQKDKKKFVLKLFEVNTSAYFPKTIKGNNE
jgi:hypothetical protein